MRMLSASVSLKSRGACGVNAARGGTMKAAGSRIAAPFQSSSPASAAVSPTRQRSSVVLPAPTSPVTTTKSPRARSRSTSAMPRSVPG